MAKTTPARPAQPGQPPKPQNKPVTNTTRPASAAPQPARPPQAARPASAAPQPSRPPQAARPGPAPGPRPPAGTGAPPQPAARPTPSVQRPPAAAVRPAPRPAQPQQARRPAPRPAQAPPPPPAEEIAYEETAPEGQHPADPAPEGQYYDNGYAEDPNQYSDQAQQDYVEQQPEPAPAQAPTRAPAHRSTVPAVASAPGGALVGITDGVRYDQLPDHMREDVNQGKDNIQAEDLGIVQIKLMQALSPELTDRNDLRAGDFLHTGSGRNLGPEWYSVLVHFQRQFILWNPLESGGGILAQARDGIHWDPPNAEFTVTLDKKFGGDTVTWRTARTVKESGLHLWGTSNPNDTTSPPAATRMLSFLALPWQAMEDGPAILTFQRSSTKAGKQLLSRIKMQRAPMFGVVYKIKSVPDTNRQNQAFWNLSAEAMGLVKDQDLYEQFKTLNAQFSQSGFDIRDLDTLQNEPLEDDPVDAGDAGDADVAYEGQPAY